MAENNYVENSDIIQPTEIGEDVLIPVYVSSRFSTGSWSGLIKKFLVAKNTVTSSGSFTITPDVTLGTGAVDDFMFDYIKVGGKVLLTFLCRSYVITVGEATTRVELDLTGTAAEPSANFASGFLFKGSVNTGSYNAGGVNVVQDCAISTVSGTKKIQIVLNTEANVSGSDFETIVGGTITITI